VVDDDPSVHRAIQLLVLIPNWGELLGVVCRECRAARSFFALLVAISALAYVPLAFGLWSALLVRTFLPVHRGKRVLIVDDEPLTETTL